MESWVDSSGGKKGGRALVRFAIAVLLIVASALAVHGDYATNITVIEEVVSTAYEPDNSTLLNESAIADALINSVSEPVAELQANVTPTSEPTEMPTSIPTEIPTEIPASENSSIPFAPVDTPLPAIISTPFSENVSVPFAPVENVVDENLTVIEEITSPPVAPELDDALTVMLHNLSDDNDSKTTAQLPVENTSADPRQLPVNISENISLPTELPTETPTLVILENISNISETPVPNTALEVYDAEGNIVDTDIVITNDSVLIDFNEGPIKSMELLDAENVSELPRVDDVPTNFSSPVPGTVWAQVYAIDPTNTSFAEGVVEVVAAGTKLYKCKDWNFDARSCDGDWVLVADDMVPGNTYYLHIDPTDPAFGEIIATAAVHLDENNAIVSDIFEQIKSEDDIWSEPIPANHTVRVTFETELTDGNVIDFIGRTNGSLVDVEIYDVDTGTLVGASRRFDRQMHEFVELSGVPSPTDTFDLKIIGQPTPECSPDDDCGFTYSVPLMEFDFINDRAISSAGAEGVVGYSIAGNAAPQYRSWNLTSQAWSVNNTALTSTSEATWVVMKSSHEFNHQFLMGVEQTDTNISLQIGNGYNSTAANTTNWAQRFNLSFDVPNTARRSLDIGIEDISGRALIAFETAAGADTVFALREWNGTALGPNITVNISPPAGGVLWLRAIPRPRTDEVMILALTSNADLWATLWNGTGLVNNTGFNITLDTGITTFEVFDFAWQQDGNGLLTYRQAAQTQIQLRTFNSTNRAWSTNSTLMTLNSGVPQMLRLCADPTSNYVGFISHDSTDDANVRIWNGTGIEAAPAPPAENIDLEPTAAPASNVDCAWMSDGSNATFVFALAPPASDDLFAYVMYNKTVWNPSSLATPSNSTSVTGGPSIEYLELVPNPVSREIHALTIDAAASDDLISALFNFTNWSVNPAGNYLLETTVTAACSGTTLCAGFDWDQFDPVPNATIIIPVNGTTVSSGAQVNITVNGADNLNIANIAVNVTEPNSTVVRLNLSLFQGSATVGNWSVNFTNTALTGQYNFTICANDTSTHNNVNCTAGFFSVANASATTITNASVVPTILFAGNNVCLLVNVTDADGVGNVTATIDRPLGADQFVTLLDNVNTCNSIAGDGIYSNLYHTTIDGLHNWTVVNVTDALGNPTTAAIGLTFDVFLGGPTFSGNLTPTSAAFHSNATLNVSLINVSDDIYATQPVLVGVLVDTFMYFNWSLSIGGAVSDSNATIEMKYGSILPSSAKLQIFNNSVWVDVCLLPVSSSDTSTNCDLDPFINGNTSKINNLSLRTDTKGALLLSAVQSVDYVYLNAINSSPAPTVVILTPANGSSFLLNDTVNISANVTDDGIVDTVLARITLPDGTNVTQTLANSSSIYSSLFANLTERGNYTIRIVANDTQGNFNNIQTTTFKRRSLNVIDMINMSNSFLNYSVGVLSNISGILNLTINISGKRVKMINVTNFNDSSMLTDLMVDDEQSSNESPFFAEYALDPSNFSFANATVVITAIGDEILYKCANYNSSAQDCIDSNWTAYVDIVAGQNYTIFLTPSGDPGFLETSAASDVAMAPINLTTFVIAFIDNGTGNASFRIMNTNGSIIVNTTVVDTVADNTSRIDVAMMNTTNFVIAWAKGPSGNTSYKFFQLNGSNTSGQFNLGSVGVNKDIAVAEVNGTGFMICYANDTSNQAEFKLFLNNGTNTTGILNVDVNMGPGAPDQNLVDCAGVNTTRWVYNWFDDATNDVSFDIRNQAGGSLTGEVDLDTDVGETGQVAEAALDNDKVAFVFYDSTDQDITIAIRTINNTVILAPSDMDTNPGATSRVAASAVRLNDTATNDSFVIAWWNSNLTAIRAAVVNSTGGNITAPFTVDSSPNSTFMLLDVMGRVPITNTTICPGRFVVAYTNSSGRGVFKGFFVNGTTWDGTCNVLLSVTKTDNPDPVSPNGTLSYQINITNTGLLSAFNVTAVESYPGNVAFVSSSPAPTSGNNTFALGTLSSGSAATINITVRVSSAINNVTLSNGINVTFANVSGQNATVSAVQNTTVTGPNLTLIKTDTPDPVVKGTQLNYTISYNVSFMNLSNNLSIQNVRFLTNNSLEHDSPNAIKTRNGSIVIAYTEVNGTGFNVYVKRSIDDGQTFSTRQITFDTVNSDRVPNIMQANDNTVYVVFSNLSVNGSGDIYIINSTNDGVTWGGSRLLFNTTNVSEFEPTMDQNSSGMYFLTYESVIAPNLDFEIYIRNSTNTVNWSSPIQLTNNSFEDFDADLIVGVNDTVFIVWAPAAGVNGTQIIELVNTTNPLVPGLLTSLATVITNTTMPDFEPSLFQSNSTNCGGNNSVYIAWVRLTNASQAPLSDFNRTSNEIFIARSTNLAQSFTTFQATNNNISDTYPGLLEHGATDFFQISFLRAGASEMELAFGTVGTRPGDAFNVTITDSAPPNTTIINSTVSAGGNVSGSTVTWSFPQLFECESGFVFFGINVSSTLSNGTIITNTANVNFASGSGVNNSRNSTTTTAVRGIPVTVTIKNDNPDPVVRGALLNYTILVNNTGDEIAYNVTLVDTYPPNVTFVSSSPAPTVGNGTFSLGNLSPNQSTTVNITVRVSSILTNGTTITNLANATFANLSGSNSSSSDTETTTIRGIPTVFTNKTDAPDPVVNGTTLRYTILINNTGDEIAYNVTVFDLYPSRVTFNGSQPAPTSGNNTWNLGNLTNGSFTTINITVNVSASNGTILNNSYNVTFANLTGTNQTVTNSTTTTVQGVGVIVTIKNDNPDPVVRGSLLNYTILVNNTGDNTVFNVSLVDTYPPNVTFVSSSPAPTVGNGTFALGNFSPNQSILVNITVRVGPTVLNGTVLSNLANATFANVSGANSSASDTENTTVRGIPQVFANKSDSPDPVVNGTTLRYQITINNNGDEIAYNISVFDLYPSRVQFNGSQPVPSVGNNTFNIGNLTNGTSFVINITVNVSAANGTILNNSFNATFANLSGVNTTITNSTTTTVQGVGVIVTIKNDNPDPVVRGSLLNYTILVNNTGDNTVFNVSLVDTYPPNVTFVSSSPSPTSGNGTFALGNFSPNQSTTVNITVRVGPTVLNGTVLNNLANATFANLTGANASASDTETTTVRGIPTVFTNKTDSPDPVVKGATLRYTILINNTGDEIAYNVTVFDIYPPNVTFNGSQPAPSSGNNTWNLGNLTNGSFTTINITVNVSANISNGTVLNNSYNVTFANLTGTNQTVTNSTTTTVQGIGVIVTIKNDNPDPVVRGALLNYTILVNNTGDEIAYNVSLVDTYPPNVTFISSSPAPTAGNGTFSLGNLTPNQSTTVNITVRVGPTVLNGTVLSNLANATFANVSGANSSASDTELTTVIGFPQVFANKSDLPDPVVNGTTLSYQILVTNNGDEIAYNVTVVDVYPVSGVTFNGSSPSPNVSNNTWFLGNLANGSSTTINITVNVSAANGTILNNSFNATFANASGVNTAITNSTTTTVRGIGVIVTIKNDNPDPVIRGQLLNYTILVNNTGDELAYNVTLVDTYPPNVTFVSSSPSPTLGNDTFSLGNLTPNQSTTVNITVRVGPTVRNGTILNNLANATFANLTGASASASDTEATTVIGFPVIITAKSDSPDAVASGATLSYQILINNTGDEIAYNVTVFELYPFNVTFNGSSPVPNISNNTWFLGNLANDSSTTINITVNVSSAMTSGVLNNSYNVTFANNSGTNFTVTNSTTTTVVPEGMDIANITLSKSDFPDPVIKGQQLNYSILVNSTGNGTAFNVTIVEGYPAGVVFHNSSPAPTSGNNTFALGNLTNGTSFVINITVNVSAGLTNGTVLTNDVNGTFQFSNGASDTRTDSESTTVIGFPQVFANKSDSPDPVVNGSTLSYQILISNTGDEIAYNVTVVDVYPISGVTFNGSSPAPNVSNNTWFLGNIQASSFKTVNITVNVSAANGTVLNNSFNATFANNSGVNLTVTNSTTTTVQGVGVIVTIKNDNPDPVIRGQNLNYTILVNNTGDEIAYNITLIDTYPPNVTFVSSSPSPTSGNGTFALGNFSPNQSILVNITVTVGPTVLNGTVLSNLANVTFANVSGANASSSDTEATTVIGFPQVFTNKSDSPDPVVNGTTLSYQILISNTGDEIAYNVTVVDVYPILGVTFNGSSPSPNISNNTWLLGNLFNGSSTTINITVNVSAANGTVLNNSYNVTFANNSGTNFTVTNSTTTTVQGVGVIVTIKNDNPDPVVRGALLNYTILVNNTGDNTVFNVTLVDTYPPNVTFISSSPTPTSGNGTFSLGNFFPNQSILVNITVRVGPTVLNGTILNNLANATFANLTGANASAFDTESTTVVGFPEVFANKSDTPDPVVNGSTLSYQITIANTGDEIAYNVTVFDLYPISGVTFNGSSPSPNVSNNTWLLGNVINGSSTTINITVNVSAANGTVLNNSFNATFANVSGTNLTITNSTTTTVQGTASLVTVKSDAPDPVVRGQLLNYSILVNNIGDEIAYNITLIDTYPPNVTFISASPSPTSGNNTFALGNFSPNQSILVNITVRVGPTVLNGTVLSNLANATFANVSGANSSASDTETTTVVGFPEVFANKSDTPDPVINGTALAYQITIFNSGDEIAYNVTVFDLYPIFGVTFNSSSPSPNISNNTWLLGNLVNGSGTTINITVNVSAANGTVLNNSFNVTFANNSGTNFTVTNSTTTTVQGIGVIVTIKNDNPDPVVRGQNLNYTILVNNTGDEIAYNVTLVDVYPPNVTFVSSSPSPTSGNGTFSLGNFSPNQSILVNITVTVGPTVLNGTVLNNLANVTFANVSGANASSSDTEATTVIGFPQVFTNKSDSPDPVINGTTLSYQILINNTGDEIAYNVTVFDLYPSGVIFNGSSPAPTIGNNTWLLGNLSNGSFTTINITVNVSAANGTVLNNSYNVTFANNSGTNFTVTNSTTTTVQGIGVIVTIKNDNPDPVVRGQNLNYTILVNNTGDEIVYNVTLVDTYPPNVSFVSSSPSPTSGNGTFALGNFSPNQSILVNITVTVGPNVLNGTVLNNLANATFTNFSGANSSSSDTEATTVVGFPEVFANKSDTPDPVVNGSTLSYQITIFNSGDEIAYNVTVFDLYPLFGVTFNGSSPAPNISNNTWLFDVLANGSSTTINITVNVSAANGTILNNSFNVTFANNSGVNLTVTNSTTTTVEGVGVIVTIKNDNPDPVIRGQMLNYTILVNNTGDEIAYNVTLVDVYPPNVTFISASPSPTSGNNTFALGNFSPNQSILVNITVTVGPTVLNGTVLSNLANVTFANVSGANSSSSDTESTTVIGFPEVFANKSDSPDPVINGSTLSYQITVANTGDEIAYNVTVFDLYPIFGVTFNGSSPSPNISNNTWFLGDIINGSSTNINITVNVSAANGTVLNNSFNATFANYSGVNTTITNSTTTTVQGIGVIVTIKNDSPDPVIRGQNLNYTILVNNTGDEIVYNVTLVDVYPPNVSFVSSSPAPTSGNDTFALGNFSPNQSILVNITVTVGPTVLNGTVLNNLANVTFANVSGTNASSSDTEATTVIGFPVVMTSKGDNPDPVTSGSTLSYQIVINNTGDEIAYNVTVFDLYPFNVTFNGSSPLPNVSNNTWFLGDITNGSLTTINITVNVSSAMSFGVLNNSYNVTFANNSGTNFTVTNNSLTTVITPGSNTSNISLSKSDSPDPVVKGQQLNYSIEVNSTGNGTAFNVTIVEGYPPNVSFVSSSPAPTSGNNTFALGNLTSGTSFVINITVDVSAGLSNGTVLTNTINGTFQLSNGFSDTKTDSESTTVIGFPTVNVTKTGSPDPAFAGGILFYQILVNNTGDEIAYNGTLIDTYPAEVSFNNASPSPTTGNDTWSIGNLSPNQSFQVNISVNVSSAVANGTVINNTANVSFLNFSGQNDSVQTTENTTIAGIGTFCPAIVTSSIVVSTSLFAANGCFTITADNVTIDCDGNTIIYAINGTGNAIQAIGRNNVTVKNCILIQNNNTFDSSNGILFDHTNNSFAINNTGNASGTNSYGIFLNVTANDSVLNNTASGNLTAGLFLQLTSASFVFNATTFSVIGAGTLLNMSDNNTLLNISGRSLFGSGIELSSSNDNVLSNIAGSTDTFIAIELLDSNRTNITNTTAFAEAGFGVLLENAFNNTLVNNTITTNTAPFSLGISEASILFFDSSGNGVFNSTIYGNATVGVEYLVSSANNTLENTTMFSNGSWLFSDATSIENNLTNTTFEAPAGSIRLPSNITMANASNVSVGLMNITFNDAFINNVFQFLNTTGVITLRGLPFTNPVPLVAFEDDGSFVVCNTPTCIPVSYTGGTFLYNVFSFSAYSATELANASVVKLDAPDPVLRGTQLLYTIVVNNTGNITIFNVTVNESYPSGVIFSNSSPAPVFGNSTFVLGTVAPNATTTLNITVNVSALLANNTILNNSVNVTFNNTFGGTFMGNASTLTTVRGQHNLTVLKADDPDPVGSGGTLSYQIRVNNTGDDTAFNITVIDIYQVNVTFNGSTPAPISGNNTFAIGTLEPNESATINITVNVSTAMSFGILNNTVFVNGTNFFGGNRTTNTTTITTVIPAGLNNSNITLAKIDSPDPVVKGTLLNYTIIVNSTGNGTAFNVTIIEGYPANVSFVSSSPAPTSGNGTFALGNLSNGTETTINITVSVGSGVPNGTILINTVNSTFKFSNGLNGSSTDSESTTVIGFSVINVTKTSSPNPVTNGSVLSYQITITNSGDEIAYNVTVVEAYPANVSFISSSPPPSLGNDTFLLGNILPGASTTVNITLSVSGNMTSGVLGNAVNVTFTNTSGANETVNTTTNTTVIPFVPPTPPSGGGGGSGGAASAVICPAYCRNPRYQDMPICRSAGCMGAAASGPGIPEPPYSGIKPKSVTAPEKPEVPSSTMLGPGMPAPKGKSFVEQPESFETQLYKIYAVWSYIDWLLIIAAIGILLLTAFVFYQHLKK